MRSHKRTASNMPPGTFVLVYDEACGFCRRCASFIERHAKSELVAIGFDDAVSQGMISMLSEAQIRESSHFVTPAGLEYHGGESVTRALRLVRGGWLLAPLNLPLFSVVRDLAYTLVASNRPLVRKILRVR